MICIERIAAQLLQLWQWLLSWWRGVELRSVVSLSSPGAAAEPLAVDSPAIPGAGFGAPGFVASLRASGFARLRDTAYCDVAGAAPYSEAHVALCASQLASCVLGNPHSSGGGGGASDAALDACRAATLEWCRAVPGEYVCVLTSGATSAVKLLGECLPWSAGSAFAYAAESHACVVGLREAALRAGGTAGAVLLDKEVSGAWRCDAAGPLLRRGAATADSASTPAGPCLFALPAECNFSGARFDLSVVAALQSASPPLRPPGSSSWLVLLDAAKACATAPPDLRRHKPHFIALSHYKVFGYPTGLGALLVRSDVMPLLTAGKAYWSGGTFSSASSARDVFSRAPGAAGLEDGTPPFTSALCVPSGFALLSPDALPGGVSGADAHACAIAAFVATSLRAMRHHSYIRHRGEGEAVDQPCPAVVVYGWGERVASSTAALSGQGPTVAFNVVRRGLCGGGCGSGGGASRAPPSHPAQRFVPPHLVCECLRSLGVFVRAGCFCNPGACAAAFDRDVAAAGLPPPRSAGGAGGGGGGGDHSPAMRGVVGCRRGGGGGDADEWSGVGAVRASFGYSSSEGDAFALLSAIRALFVDAPLPPAQNVAPAPSPAPHNTHVLRVAELRVYPIKGGRSATLATHLHPPPLPSSPHPRAPCSGRCASARGGWPLSPSGGLMHDREWAVVDAQEYSTSTPSSPPHQPPARPLTQLSAPRLALLAPTLDACGGVVTLRVDEPRPPDGASAPLVLSLQNNGGGGGGGGGDGAASEAAADEWISAALGRPCRLVRAARGAAAAAPRCAAGGGGRGNSGSSGATTDGTAASSRSFANVSPIAVVTEASLDALRREAEGAGAAAAAGASRDGSASSPFSAARFRPNIVLSGGAAWAEEDWASLVACDDDGDGCCDDDDGEGAPPPQHGARLDVVAPCARCPQVCVDPATGLKEGRQPLDALTRRSAAVGRPGRPDFGLLLCGRGTLRVGQRVRVTLRQRTDDATR